MTVREFWADFGAWMRPELTNACTRIAETIEDDWACCYAQDMSALWLHDIQPVFDKCGGKATWAFRVEQSLGFEFKRVSSTEPASARFAVEKSSEPAQRETPASRGEQLVAAAAMQMKLGDKLHQDGTLRELNFQDDIFKSCLISTVNPKKQVISKPEKENILRTVWRWRVAHGSSGKDTFLLHRIATILRTKFPYIPGAEWYKSLWYQAGNRFNRRAVKVRVPFPSTDVCAHAV